MAFLTSLLLTVGSFLSILLHFSDLPQLIETIKKERSVTLSYQTYLGSHFSHLLWVVYSLQLWDPDFAIPSVVMAVLTLAYLWIIHTMAKSQVKFSSRYALATPLALLVLWRAVPLWVVGLLASVASLYGCLPAIRRIEDFAKGTKPAHQDIPKLGIYCLRNCVWVLFGYLKGDFCITSAFAAHCFVAFTDLALALRYPAKRPVRRKPIDK